MIMEELLALATGFTKLLLTVESMSTTGVHFRTRNLPWGWSGGVESSNPWIDLRGPWGSQLFVSAESNETMHVSRVQQQRFLGFHFTSLTFHGRTGVGGGGSNGHLFLRWAAIPSHRPGTTLLFLYQTRLPEGKARQEFEESQDWIEIVELLP